MELTDALFDLCKTTPRPIIAIDGPAGAGKTTLAEHLTVALSLRYKVTTIHMDSLYNGWDAPFDEHLKNSLLKAATSHKKGAPFSLSYFDWSKGEFGSEQAIAPAELLIFEGVGSSQTIVRPYLAASIWIDVEAQKGLERVLLRDGEEISEEMKRWLVLQGQHFAEEESEKSADFILTT
jgi:uridine kinase